MVRGAFTVKPGLRAAYACTTALGLYNVYLNGQKVSTDEMTPGWTSYNRRLLYQTYEVTAMLHPGLNMAGAMLGAGWYKGVMGLTRSRNNYGDTTAFAMQLTLVYADGTRETVNTGPAWQGTKAPVIFSEIYHGEAYDAALELPHWAECETPENTPAGRWHAVHTVPYPAAKLAAQAAGKVCVQQRIPAQRVFTAPDGSTVVDFGQNMAGRVEITVQGTAGQVAELRCFEELDADGNPYLANLRKARYHHAIYLCPQPNGDLAAAVYLYGIPLCAGGTVAGKTGTGQFYRLRAAQRHAAGGGVYLFRTAGEPVEP